MEDVMIRKVPGFGNWDFCGELPVTHYFRSAMPAGSIRDHLFEGKEDDDLFKVPTVPTKPAYRHHLYHHGERKKKKKKKKKKKEQARACYVISKAPKAVDEDLYKIPPELLYQIPKRKRIQRNFWSGCLGLSCIA